MICWYILFSFFCFKLLSICSFSFKTGFAWYILIFRISRSIHNIFIGNILLFVFCWIIKFGIIWLVCIIWMKLGYWAFVRFIVYSICRLQKLRIVMAIRNFIYGPLRMLCCDLIRFIIVMIGCLALKGNVGMGTSMPSSMRITIPHVQISQIHFLLDYWHRY